MVRQMLELSCQYNFNPLKLTVSVGLIGYTTYGTSIDSDLLLSYPDEPPVIVANVFISLLVCLLPDLCNVLFRIGLMEYRQAAVSYPIQVKPARDSVISLMGNSSSPTIRELADKQSTFVATTAAFLLLSFGVALATSNLGIIIELLGATCSGLVVFIIPTLCFLKLYPEPCMKRNLSHLVLCVGIVLMPTCVVATFL